MKPVLSLNNVSANYDNLDVLDSLNFSTTKREFISIVGPSGCGKTTLLKIIGGLKKPRNGSVLINNDEIDRPLAKKNISFIFQNPVLLPWRNVIENIRLPLEISKKNSSVSSLKDIIKIVGLEKFGEAYPNELSGGMKQRVALARALINNPSILLMDEPFGALDELTRDKLNLEILKIWEISKEKISTIVFVTHSISEAVFLSDKIIILSKRPAKIKGLVNIDLPRPRNINIKDTKRYKEIVKCLRNILQRE